MKIRYARVLILEQNLDLQINALKNVPKGELKPLRNADWRKIIRFSPISKYAPIK